MFNNEKIKINPVPRAGADGNPNMIKVLMYHRIVEKVEFVKNHWTCVTVDDFHRHLELLTRWGFTAITFEDYRLFLEGALNLPRHPVIITFDDGYKDTYDLAYPLLQEYGMKAVVFVLGDRTIKTNYWDQTLGMKEAQLLGPEEIDQMFQSGIEIGAHSTTHPKLTMIPKEKAWEEISQSKTLLEAQLGAPVRSFCYPYGMVNNTVKQLVRDAGFSIGCSVDSGPVSFGEDQFETDNVFDIDYATRDHHLEFMVPMRHQRRIPIAFGN